jgi:hypothetical protein
MKTQGIVIRMFLVGLPLGLIVSGVFAMWYYYNGADRNDGQEHALRREPNAADLAQYVAVMRGIGDRDVLHPLRLERAWKFIKSSLGERNMGYEVKSHRFEVADQKCVNLYVDVEGRRSPDEVILVVANYDGLAEGESAEGTAALLSLANAFVGTEPARTIRVLALSNEEGEHSPKGSDIVARKFGSPAMPGRVMQTLYLSGDASVGEGFACEKVSARNGLRSVEQLKKTIEAIASGRLRLE